MDENPDFLFITGGLGPTHDDITRNAIKEFFNLEEGFDSDYYEKLIQKFAERGISIPESNKSQALIYHNCQMLDNPKGTARGLFIKFKNTKVFVLPGVPIEMKAIFENSIVTYLPKLDSNPVLTLRSFGIAESHLAEKLSWILERWESKVNFAFLPSHKGVDLRLSLKDSKIDLNEVSQDIHNNFGQYFFGKNEEKLEHVIVHKLIEKKWTFSVAESCTGGRLANYITNIPRSSEVFLGGVVAYSNQLKIDFLEVNKNSIEKFGAVSDEIAIQMAEGIKNKTNSDFGIGITGISGPTGGTPEKPLGLVYIAITFQNITKVKNFTLKLDRKQHQEMTAYIALNMIRRYYFGK